MEVRLLHPALAHRDLAVERRREAEHDAALHLGRHPGGVHRRSAIHRAHDAVHADAAVLHGDLRHLGDVAVERVVHGQAAEASRRQRPAPAGALGGQVQDAEVPRVPRQQGPAIGERILARRVRQLVDQRLHHVGGVRMSHRAPPERGHGQAAASAAAPGDAARPATYGESSTPSTEVGSTPSLIMASKGPARDEGLADQRVLPRQRRALRVEAHLHLVEELGAVVPAAHVVLARPHHLHRQLRRLGDVDGLPHEVGGRAWRGGRTRRPGTGCGS